MQPCYLEAKKGNTKRTLCALMHSIRALQWLCTYSRISIRRIMRARLSPLSQVQDAPA